MKPHINVILLGIVIILESAFAQAGANCKTVSECLKKQQQPQEIGDFLRYDNGKVITVESQKHAALLCKAFGARLPTARELAIEATKNGAEILEIDFRSYYKHPNSFMLVNYINQDGSSDKFFFSSRSYVPPRDGIGSYTVWSSSLHLHSLDWSTPSGSIYVAGGEDFGALLLAYHDYSEKTGKNLAVRCVSSAPANR